MAGNIFQHYQGAMVLINELTLLTKATAITFPIAGETYKQIRLISVIISGETITPPPDTVYTLTINGDTGINYSIQTAFFRGAGYLFGNSENGTGIVMAYNENRTKEIWANVEILNTHAGRWKSVLVNGLTNDNSDFPNLFVGASSWRNTAAIADLTVTASAADGFGIGSYFAIYGRI